VLLVPLPPAEWPLEVMAMVVLRLLFGHEIDLVLVFGMGGLDLGACKENKCVMSIEKTTGGMS
jgi:hypothetical protein